METANIIKGRIHIYSTSSKKALKIIEPDLSFRIYNSIYTGNYKSDPSDIFFLEILIIAFRNIKKNSLRSVFYFTHGIVKNKRIILFHHKYKIV